MASSSHGMSMSIPVAQASADVRAAFVVRTYLHLLGAILAFTAIEVALFRTGIAWPIAKWMWSTHWLLILGGFIVVNWMASSMAHSVTSAAAQYFALTIFILAEALIFIPLLAIAFLKVPGAIENAAVVTLVGFGGLTAVAFISRQDFSFLRGILMWGLIVALVLIVSSVVFGFQLGTLFSVAMIAFAGGAILYDMSNVLHHYPEDRHVAASLQLFAAVALMFWYVLRLFISRD